MNSTTSQNKRNKIPLWSIALWLLVWQAVSMLLHSDILLVSPIKVLVCLAEKITEADFWRAVGSSSLRIGAGFMLALLLGIILSALSYAYKPVHDLLKVPVSVIKSTPVASFIILILIWIPSRNLSVIISFLMSFPVIYSNLSEGLNVMDSKMLEMADVFRLPFSKRLRFIYIPQVIPYFESACFVALGFSWKAGIAAEIIGLPRGSLGERLYEAKIYLNTPEMFAWTVTIILVSLLFEKITMFLINKAMEKLEGK
ncbi:MAG: ABC transporter permease subunit [Lachnospiraceae bacterium]|nr:ABC transporter permease subunit [Lachnospiraceae bacterium]